MDDPLAELRKRVEAVADEISAEAQAIEDAYNADGYRGDLDADELNAEVLWACSRKIRGALNP